MKNIQRESDDAGRMLRIGRYTAEVHVPLVAPGSVGDVFVTWTPHVPRFDVEFSPEQRVEYQQKLTAAVLAITRRTDVLLERTVTIGRYAVTLTVRQPRAINGAEITECDCTWSPEMPPRFESAEDEWAFERARIAVMKEAGALLERRMVPMAEDA